MPIAMLPHYRDWLLDGQRDLEIQDTTQPAVLDGDWTIPLAQARMALRGYQGRLGIHGPFDGLPLKSRDPKVQALVAGRLRQALEFGGELGASHMAGGHHGTGHDRWLC